MENVVFVKSYLCLYMHAHTYYICLIFIYLCMCKKEVNKTNFLGSLFCVCLFPIRYRYIYSIFPHTYIYWRRYISHYAILLTYYQHIRELNLRHYLENILVCWYHFLNQSCLHVTKIILLLFIFEVKITGNHPNNCSSIILVKVYTLD